MKKLANQTFESQEHKKYSQEVDKQYEVVYGAAIIVLKELHHWRDERIKRLLDCSEEVWKRIQMQGSMQNVMQICEQETGIVMKLRGKPYKEEDVFQMEWIDNCDTQPKRDYIYMSSRPWVANGFIAALCIGLHKAEGWGRKKRLPEFIDNVRGVTGEWRSAYNYEELLNYRYDMQFEMKYK